MNKQTLIVVLIAVVLVAALLLHERVFREEPGTARPEAEVTLYQPITEDECAQILMSGFGTSTTLVRKDRQWYTRDGFPADPDAVSRLFDALENFGEPELISINPNAFLKFRVDSMLGIQLTMIDTQGKPRVDLIIGEMGKQDFFHSPVRRPGSNNVYRVSGMLRHMLNRRDWRDFSVWRLAPENLTRVAVERSTDSFAVQRDAGGTWWFSEPTSAPVDAQKVQSWTQRVATLKANEFEEASDPDMLTTFGLTSPSVRLSVAAEDGSSYTLVFGNLEPKKKQYYAKRTDDPQVYRFYEYTCKDILKKSADLKPAPKPKPPPRPVPTPPPPPAPTQPTTGPAAVPAPAAGGAAPTKQPVAPVPPPAPRPDGPTTAPLP